MPAKQKIPGKVIFLGHGSPLNALADNDFTRALRTWGAGAPRPDAIIAISAHWQTRGTFVSCQADPQQIYDFYGFPDVLYQVAYPCAGDPALARRMVERLNSFSVRCSDDWGIDHGTWAVLKHLYPAADVPVVQISLDMTQPPEYHYRLARALAELRRENLLILGSGNIVHNLSLISWEENAPPAAWAEAMDEELKIMLEKKDHSGLIAYPRDGAQARRGIPTLDHYLPMIYALGLQSDRESIRFIYEGFQNGSLSMRCFELA
jgi:4,5-DOPA dioxygenase extradiol